MDEYDDYYFDDAMQGSEGGFGGYGDELYQDPTINAGQNTDYNYFDQNPSFGGNLQGLFGTENDGILGNSQMPNFGGVDFGSELPQGNIPQQQQSYGDMFTKLLGGLGNMFAPQNQKKASSVLGALLEGYQNKQNSASTRNIIQQQQQQADPFGSQRPYYQQQLQQSVADPYGSKIVQDQVSALKRAQDIKNAAAGRRSNSATTDPELLKAMADIAMKYQQSLYQPAGAGISPNMVGTQGLIDANKQNTQGYISPLLSALGYNVGSNTNQGNTDQALANFVKIMSTINKGQ